MNISSVINMDPDIQFGAPVFAGTRVPVLSLFLHLEKGISIDDFLIDFPSVKKEQCFAAIELAGKLMGSQKFLSYYEDAA
jgi:uncharacterized protein (DUF433 family)